MVTYCVSDVQAACIIYWFCNLFTSLFISNNIKTVINVPSIDYDVSVESFEHRTKFRLEI